MKVIYNMNVSTEPGSTFYYGFVSYTVVKYLLTLLFRGNHMQVLGYMAQNKTGIDWKVLFATYLTKPLQLAMRYGGQMNPRMAGT